MITKRLFYFSGRPILAGIPDTHGKSASVVTVVIFLDGK